MISTTEHLIKLCNSFLNGELTDHDFEVSFESYLEDHADQMEEKQYRSFEPVLDAVAFYQPDPAIRSDDKDNVYLDKAQLCEVIRKVLAQVQN